MYKWSTFAAASTSSTANNQILAISP